MTTDQEKKVNQAIRLLLEAGVIPPPNTNVARVEGKTQIGYTFSIHINGFSTPPEISFIDPVKQPFKRAILEQDVYDAIVGNK